VIRFSLVQELPPSRWGRAHIPNRIPPGWNDLIKTMRMLWDHGDSTLLETAFVHWFQKPQHPIERLRQW
jgi:hypothetical protein